MRGKKEKKGLHAGETELKTKQFIQNRENERWGKERERRDKKLRKDERGGGGGGRGGQETDTERGGTETLAVGGHGCRRGDCGMQLKLAWTLSLSLRPGHGALSGTNTHTQTHTDTHA